MKEKTIVIELNNGETYHLPASVVAMDRTTYYAEVDGFEKDSPEWTQEYAQSMNNDELKEWLQNNMNWVDIKPHAIRVADNAGYDYQEGFINADITIVNK